MKKWINELKDGERTYLLVLLHDVARGITNKGVPYLSLNMQDKTGTIEGKYWNIPQEDLNLFHPGMIIEIKGDVLSYKDQLQIKVFQARPATKEYDIRDFVKSAPLTKDDMKEKIEDALHHIQNEQIRSLCHIVYEEVEKDFYEYPAATKNHHDMVGGLAMHVYGMMNLASSICELYPLLDRDLLMAGVFLHDIGKLVELSGPVASEYTMEGKLLGHISIMHAKVSELAKSISMDKETEVLLRHMILSHHGLKEYGSPVQPMIPEAEVLYYIDNLDAKMHMLEKAMDKTEEGHFSTRIYAMDNRSFYKKKQTS
ncbi:MAG: HD domain-containing protein [Erysipelotrichaceae bacterium]|nr:HD domain-containing protein [Erysipelotrichaceae bacterium]